MPAYCPGCRELVEKVTCPLCRQSVAVDALKETGSESFKLPPDLDTTLPFFAYGLFKPGELAFGQIRDAVEGTPKALAISGSLRVRDGLPLLQTEGGGQVNGYLIRFKNDRAEQAYGVINCFEPRKHYRWEATSLSGESSRANVLVGRSINKGSEDYEESTWSAWRDPVFEHGLKVVRDIVRELAADPFDSAPPDNFDWDRFFRIQAAYLLLWAAIERFAALAFGPSLDPNKKVDRLSKSEAFARAVSRNVSQKRAVIDSRKPDSKDVLDPENPASAADYYYTVRSNLSHRGKGAFRDGETVRLSLIELEAILRDMIDHLRAEAVPETQNGG